MRKFIRINDKGSFYAAISKEGYFRVGIFKYGSTIPFSEYVVDFSTQEQAEEVAKIISNAYNNGHHDGQLDTRY